MLIVAISRYIRDCDNTCWYPPEKNWVYDTNLRTCTYVPISVLSIFNDLLFLNLFHFIIGDMNHICLCRHTRLSFLSYLICWPIVTVIVYVIISRKIATGKCLKEVYACSTNI